MDKTTQGESIDEEERRDRAYPQGLVGYEGLVKDSNMCKEQGSEPREGRNQGGKEPQRTQLHPPSLRYLFNSSLGSDGLLWFLLSVNACEVGAGCSL